MSCEQIISDALKIGIPSIVTVIVLIVSNVYMAKRQKNDFVFQEHKQVREKREQLMTALFTYSVGLRDYYVNVHNFWAGVGDHNSLNDEIKRRLPQQQESEIQIRMLTTLYFPDIQSEWEQFYSDKNEFSKKLHGYNGHEVAPLSKDKLTEIVENNNRYSSAIKQMAKNLANGDFGSEPNLGVKK